MVIMWIMFFTTDRKAGDPSQAGDQTDGKLRDSKERWVAMQYMQGEADSSISLQLVSWFSLCLNHCTHLFILHLLLYSLNYLAFIGYIQPFGSMRWPLSPTKRALVLTQWCTYRTQTQMLTRTHTHSVSESLSLSSFCRTPTQIHSVLLSYFYQLLGRLIFLLRAVSEHTKSTEVSAKSKTENESKRK